MAIALRICLYEQELDVAANAQFLALDESARGRIADAFEQLEGVTVLDCCTDWTRLQEHLQFANVDAVAVNLDRLHETPRFLSIQRIAEVAPNCTILGISGSADPDAIIGAMRAGCTQFVRAPIDAQDLRSALDRIRQTRLAGANACQQIALMGASGGAGATTVASNLALELAHITGQRVGLVDMNLQFGDVACAFDIVPKYSVSDVCREGVNVDRTMLEMALDQLPCNVSVLARPENLEDAEEVTAAGVEQVCRQLGQMFPAVIVDLPRNFTAATIAAMRSSDHMLIVSQLGVPFIRNATRIRHYLLQAGIEEERIELVLNRVAAHHERLKVDEVEKHFGRAAFATIPNDYKRITASRDLGHPILATAPNSPARLAIQDLARRLAVAPVEEGNSDKKGGFLGLFRRGSKAEQPNRK